MDSSISSRIKKLVESKIFRNPEIDKLGYGTFQKPQAPDTSLLLQKAKDLRAKADAMMGESRKEGIKMLMEAIMMYIKGYTEESGKCKVVDMIYKWKSLGKYICRAIGSLGEDEEATAFLRLVLFNVKFHYLHLESSLVIKQNRRGESREGVLSYFLNEYNDLHTIFALSKMKMFNVLQPCDLEDMIRERINSI
ncbi:uncharacterized protein Eint_060810 [Encephalitozoon intestinalis ATCC 50506]|uniref:Uncharacterized protein n=1 Tax=Encephalitozoon intestinalis (strain ATCC 50506) TaxID=876142 RepID=E0S7L0_ENCIT|nr:uncharacterized protein Eint_060810 [Encephalitozoon intestinalis ATCC 50506]ADM11689.1 hypothetical protein Eint_060810 [Encephalitozoon intestinalis ATCC 50506]UTX45426.1 Lmo0651-like protein [Encephalitozoon intestinalis]